MADSPKCPKCNDTGVKSWGPVNATGRNDQIVYCECRKPQRAPSNA